MLGYYTALIVVTIFIIISAITVIYHDNVLEKYNRNIFILSYLMLLFTCISEWLVVFLEKFNSSQHFLTTLFMSFVLFLSPTITAVLVLGINDIKSRYITHLVFFIITLSFVLGFSGLFSNAIFYFDEQNIYHRGTFFPVHFAVVMLSSLTLFVNTLRLGLKYQNKNNFILVLVLFIFLGALYVQFAFEGVWILWISYSIAIAFGYIYYSSLVNQVDVLTGILNRKCYDSQIFDIKSTSIILFFDVNKFKEINDTLGHATGDYCLIKISKAIKEVYGKCGYCYRIGGDEFSVILYKNLDDLDDLNAKFFKLLSKEKYKIPLPTVSIGHSYYYPNKTSIHKVIEEADAMMYQLKQRDSLSETNLE